MSERRIAPPKEHEALLDRLTADGVFETKQKALMFAAALGFRRKRRREVPKIGTAIRYDIFERALDDGFISALAIINEDTLKALAEEHAAAAVNTFQEYAAGGLDLMANESILDTSRLLEMCLAERESDVPEMDADSLIESLL